MTMIVSGNKAKIYELKTLDYGPMIITFKSPIQMKGYSSIRQKRERKLSMG